jgi:hypothetical protein
MAAASARLRIGSRQIQDGQLADHGQHRDQNHGTHLHHGIAALGQHQQRALELERDDHREHHAEHRLERRRVGDVELVG